MQFNVSETGRFLHYKVTLKSVLFKKGTGKQSCYMRQILCFFFFPAFLLFSTYLIGLRTPNTKRCYFNHQDYSNSAHKLTGFPKATAAQCKQTL